MAASDARPVPRKNAAWRFSFAIRKNDGTLITTWAGQDSKLSLDSAAYSDCTNEAIEIGTSGTGYIDFTAAEMNADSVLIKITVTNTDALPIVVVVYPEEAGDYRVADTQKVDVDTIKTQALTAAAGITFGVYVGGTAAAAVASTALSTATWTGTLATNLGTTNTTVATNLDATVSSRLPTASYTAPPSSATISTQVASDLATAHGAGSWATATGFSTHSAADVWAVGTRTITGGSLTTAPPTAAVIADAVWDEARSGHVTAGTFGENVTAELDSATSTKIDSILEDTGNTLPAQITGLNNLSSAQVISALGTGAWATAIPWNASWDAEVQSEVQDAIETNNLDHLIKVAVDTNFATTVHLDSVIGHIADNGTAATFIRTTDSLEAIRDNQSSSGGASLEDIISGVQSVSGAIVEAQNSATLSIRIGDTWTQEIDSLGDLTGKVVTFAMKKRASDADTAAIVFITEGTGLTRLNGAATTAGWGSITINDEVAGDITLRLESDATSLLTSGSYVDAVKLLEDGDDRSPRNAGRTVVSAGVIADIT